MTHTQLPDLEKVTNAAFQKQFQALRPILEAEARIKQQLARLDGQLRQARQDSTKVEGYQVSGTDVLWNSWESATRRQLNLQLARTRAQKLAGMEALRTAFGRKQAVETLRKKVQQANRKANAKKHFGA
ncbi:hypothetical protein [Ruegeria sp. HKCCD6157]|uniref:hypothetical protein n=1 Tax=Ruegeria sp. HKCCD6157 TaxID=2690707 RepID=UPI0014923A9E|nr:hypothetical protein [Ruegeria sp. HKCCD6157]NOE27925.1 hypothetical protein [Ruegeria sp. HKCCD6157]